MMKTIYALRFAPIMLFAVAASAIAQDNANTSDLVDVQSATCAQFSKAQTYAKPPENATEQQLEFAVLAQDDLLLAITWLNGYLTARDGAKGNHAFTNDWITNHMRKLNAVCKANPGSMRLTDAAAKL
jgi:hypothetical protein